MRPLLIPLTAACLPLVALLGAASAHAEAFAGASAGLSSQQLVCAANAPCDDKAGALRLSAGWRFNDRWSFEATWLRATPDFTASDSLGSLTWNGRVAMEAISASAAFDLRLGSLPLQLRAGVARRHEAEGERQGGGARGQFQFEHGFSSRECGASRRAEVGA